MTAGPRPESRAPPPPPEEGGPRGDLRRILDAALEGVEPAGLVKEALEEMSRPARSTSASPRTVVLAVGKAAVPMARGALAALGGEAISRGLVLAPEVVGDGAPPEEVGVQLPFPVHRGGHPLPTREGRRGAERALKLVRSLSDEEHLLLLLSGGGSALLTLPAEGLSLADLRRTTRLLLEAGAPIQEVNTVRRHLERLKGGRMGLEAKGRGVTALAISDVVGNPPEAIASGPVSPDPTTYGDALEILNRYGLEDGVGRPVVDHLARGVRGGVADTPAPGDSRLGRVGYRILADIGTAIAAAAREARRTGYRAHPLTDTLTGEAREAGRRLGALARSVSPRTGDDVCLLSGGETTVRVVGPGRGGPNQELALAAAMELDGARGVLLGSMGTDGIDGPTDAAGALAAGSSLARARAAGLKPRAALGANDSYPFFNALGDLLRTGPTGTNVMDLQVILVSGDNAGRKPERR